MILVLGDYFLYLLILMLFNPLLQQVNIFLEVLDNLPPLSLISFDSLQLTNHLLVFLFEGGVLLMQLEQFLRNVGVCCFYMLGLLL